MVQGTSTRQNTSDKHAPERTSLLKSRLQPNHSTIVTPTAAANNPLSGRNSTASPTINPLTPQHTSDRLNSVDLNAHVTVNTIATARKFVITSVNTVAT